MGRNNMRKIIVIAVLLILLLIPVIGFGYAYESSYESNQNALEGRYVVINSDNAGSAILSYTQGYDTTVIGGHVVYRVPMQPGTDLVRLNSSSYGIEITDGNRGGSYALSAEAELPTLFASDTIGTGWCQFVFELVGGTELDPVKYLATTELGSDNKVGSVYTFRNADDTVASIAAGTYQLNIYLQMCSYGSTNANGTGLDVSEDNFVKRFDAQNFKIKLVVSGA